MSLGGPTLKPSFSHTKGCCCGPANSVPLRGWLLSVRLVAGPLVADLTASALSPSFSPVTRPIQPSRRSDLKAAETSLPSTVTTGRLLAPVTLIKASPPVTKLACDDSTSTLGLPALCADAVVATLPDKTAAAAARYQLLPLISFPPHHLLLGQKKLLAMRDRSRRADLV